jgi:hypothetical protein
LPLSPMACRLDHTASRDCFLFPMACRNTAPGASWTSMNGQCRKQRSNRSRTQKTLHHPSGAKDRHQTSSGLKVRISTADLRWTSASRSRFLGNRLRLAWTIALLACDSCQVRTAWSAASQPRWNSEDVCGLSVNILPRWSRFMDASATPQAEPRPARRPARRRLYSAQTPSQEGIHMLWKPSSPRYGLP